MKILHESSLFYYGGPNRNGVYMKLLPSQVDGIQVFLNGRTYDSYALKKIFFFDTDKPVLIITLKTGEKKYFKYSNRRRSFYEASAEYLEEII